MKKYEFLEHTADAKFKAYGKTLEEQFSNAAIAMFSIMTDYKIKPAIKKEIIIKGNDRKDILYNFLEELLYLLDAENLVFSKIEKIKINDELKATVFFDKTKNYKFFGEVKAVTFSEMEITKDYVQVVVDL